MLGGKDITSERLSPLDNQIMKGEELMLTLKLQYFGHLIRKAASLEKTLMLGKTEGKRRRGWQRTRWLESITGHEFEQTLGDNEGQGSLVCCSPRGHKELDTT